ncbi:MAG: hypothetical protein LBI45_00165 [Bacteroidales bacterium]|jgi:uncharacterized protein involved in exopolysaccharide biosynthesis|nr:hypothetical protein [Bacteroidales bacterium]
MDNKNEFNSFSLIGYIWKWRKLFLLVCGSAGLLAIFFSSGLFIRPQFTAQTVIYAPRTNAVSKIINGENIQNERLDIKAYAIEEETEQMMQLLNSREIKDVLIEKYGLVKYYGIKTNRKAWKAKLYKILDGVVNIKRTQFGAITISVNDWDPQQAATMANDIAAELDSLKNRIERERALAAYNLVETQIQEALEFRSQVTDSIRKLAEKGIFAYEYQAERFTQQYAIAIAQGNIAGVERLKKEMEKLANWGPVEFSLRQEQKELSEYVSFLKTKLLSAKADLKQLMPVKFVIEKAVAPDKKSYPKKIIIAILASIGTFFVMLITLLVIDRINNEIVVEPRPDNSEKKE